MKFLKLKTTKFVFRNSKLIVKQIYMSIKRISLLILATAVVFIFALNRNKNDNQNQATNKLAEKETLADAIAGKKETANFAQFTNLKNEPTPQKNKRYAAAQGGLNFMEAAGIATPAVVHIKTKMLKKASSNQRGNYNQNPFFEFFGDDLRDMFQDPNRGKRDNGQFRNGGSGSGVIISSDGYIVSNNHVVSAGDEIEVILHDNKKYTAEVVGTDKSTDIALIKIDETDLPYLNFSNSDEVRVGQWVLAVGNPFNLASTVTAGIVSAKARNINLLGDSAIESFIQTDAAVNPGNSGGALVNLNGDLIGINTAIATPTGTFAGYSFAVPANLVAKIIEDLKEFGVAQRAFIGVRIIDVSNLEAAEIKEYNINESEGVFVKEAIPSSGAAEAGLMQGDIIVEVNNKSVASMPELQESVAAFRPGDKVALTYIRNNKRYNINVVLKNENLNFEKVTKSTFVREKKYNRMLGAELAVISESSKEQLGIKGGVQIIDIKNGLLNSTDIKEGFIITKIKDNQVYTIDDIDQILQSQRGRGGVMIEGIYPDNPDQTIFYAFGM